MLNRRNYTRNGHVWNPMPDMELESLSGGGGSYFWKGGSRKGGFGRTPRTPPGYGPVQYSVDAVMLKARKPAVDGTV